MKQFVNSHLTFSAYLRVDNNKSYANKFESTFRTFYYSLIK